MTVQLFLLSASSALLMLALAVPVWLAWRYLQQPALRWMTLGYVATGVMYGLAPVAPVVLAPPGINLSALALTPVCATVFVTAIMQLVSTDGRTRLRWTWATLGLFAATYWIALPLGAHQVLRAVVLGGVATACAGLCFVQSRRESEPGLALVGLALAAFPAATALTVMTGLSGRPRTALLEAALAGLGLSVMTVVALRARKSHDRTVARNLELELELQTMAAERARKSSALETDAVNASRFVDGFNRTVAHDLKGAISAILAGTKHIGQMLQQGKVDAAVEFLPKIETQAHGAIERVAAMQRLAQSASLPLDLKKVELESVAKSALSEVRRQQFGKNVPVFLMPLPQVVCDPGLLRVFFINLLANAIKFSQDVPEPTVHIGMLQDDPDEEVIFFVRDTGVGFDPARAPELFTPFGRRESGGQGMGVGVSIASNIIERHGGRLWVESDVGQGATFFFTLGTQSLLPAYAAEGDEPAMTEVR